MLRNQFAEDYAGYPKEFLNEVLSLNAQEFHAQPAAPLQIFGPQ